MTLDKAIYKERFPKSSRYNPEWLTASVSGAANPLWMTEWLSSAMELKPGMRVLDLGCGRAVSSIFLHREFGVQVWATDLWFSAAENLKRIRDAGVDSGVFPIHADARALPFASEFFDAIISIDSYFYYGTDDLYLGYLANFVKPGGQIAIAGAGLVNEFAGAIPEHLKSWWTPDLSCLHSASWWKRHWERTGIVDVESADTMPDGWQLWVDWVRTIAPENLVEIKAIEEDRGRNLGYARAIARRKKDVTLSLPIASIPESYAKKPLLSK